MTDEEKILLRKENVRRLFRLTGDEFVRKVLDKYRSEDPAPASEICEQYDVSTHELTGRRWYKIRAKGVVPRGKTEKILYLQPIIFSRRNNGSGGVGYLPPEQNTSRCGNVYLYQEMGFTEMCNYTRQKEEGVMLWK